MATEALKAPGLLDGITPINTHRPNHAQIPHYLIGATGEFGNERGNFFEERVKAIIGSEPGVKEVIRNGKNSKEDKDGHDLTVIFTESSIVDKVHIQVKSSRQGIVDYKRKIRDSLPNKEENNGQLIGPWVTEMLITEWMTKRKIILLNGGETKSNSEILESFYPQLERIKQEALAEKKPKPIQLFP